MQRVVLGGKRPRRAHQRDLGDTVAAHKYYVHLRCMVSVGSVVSEAGSSATTRATQCVAAYESLRHALFGGQCYGWLNLDDLGTALAAYARFRRWFKWRVLTEPRVEGASKDQCQVELVRSPRRVAVAKVRVCPAMSGERLTEQASRIGVKLLLGGTVTELFPTRDRLHVLFDFLQRSRGQHS